MPSLSNFDPVVTFAENAVNAAPALLDTDVTFTSSTSLAGGRLVVSGLLAEDHISILDQGLGGLVVVGNRVFFGASQLGTVTGRVGDTFTVTFTSGATEAGVDALIQRLAFQSTSDAPTAARNLTIDVIDGAGTGLAQETNFGPLVPLTGAANPFAGLDAGNGSTPAFVDLDGDGDFDLVSADAGGTLLAWRNTGTAQTPVFTPLTGSDNPVDGIRIGPESAPAFVDLDGDGDLDLVGEKYNGEEIQVWWNTGTASAPLFPDPLFSGAPNPLGVIDTRLGSKPAFADLDGDGDFDIVVGDYSGDLRDWRNLGTALTPNFPSFLFGDDDLLPDLSVGKYSAPAFVDLDGDGDLDLVSGERNGTLLAWRNTGTAEAPVFTALTGSDNPFNGIDVGELSTPAFVDLDADGNIDLVVGRADGTFLAWRNPSPLPTIAVTITPEEDGPPSVTSVATASFAENEDGVAYQATASDPDGTTRFTWTLGGADAALFAVDGAGAVRFVAPPDFERPADADGDNVYDITLTANDGVADSAARGVAITVTNVIDGPALTGLALGVTFAENTVNGGPQLLDPSVIFTAETALAGGRLVVSGLLAEDRVSILAEGNGAGQIGVSGSNVLFGGVAIGSFAGGVGGTFTVTFGAAATGAAVDALIQRLGYANSSDTPTADRTLTLDVIDSGGRALGAGPGVGPLTALGGAANPFNGIDAGLSSMPAFVDLDGDGDRDLVSGAADGTLLAWRNTGAAAAPVFSPLNGSDNPLGAIDVGYGSTPAFVDLDGDGDLDLVSGEGYGTVLAWRNTGTASAPAFTALTGSENPFQRIDAGFYSRPVFVDLDDDRDLDLVAGEFGGTLLAWRNTGTASAPAFNALTGSDNPFNGIDVGDLSTPAFVDLDGDGDLDLVSGEAGGTLLAWRNTGTAAAPVFTALSGAANPFNGIDAGASSSLNPAFVSPAFVDLDGDGDLDLVVGEDTGTILAWRNTAPPPPPAPSITVTVTAEDERPPGITSGTTARVAENSSGIVYQASAIDPDGPTVFAWSLDGADAARFTIDAAGAVRFVTPPDFEAPSDAGGDNTYDITVTVSDGALTASQDVAITVTDAVEPLFLVGGPSDDRLRGRDLYDTLIGGAGNDRLDGGRGRDWMEGGSGDDVYVVDQVGEIVVEEADGGIDRIISTVSILGLQPNVEHVRLEGSADIDAEGNDLDNVLQGNAGRNVLLGLGGDDRLDGRGGVDSMAGGAGDDVYVVDDVREFLVEEANEGADRVVTLVDWTLGSEFEFLTLIGIADIDGTGNGLNNGITGNAGANVLSGGAGNDRLAGLGGADTLIGGLDNDVYVVADADDLVIEEAEGGMDRAVSSVDWTLGEHVEQLVLRGSADLAGTGNALGNLMVGNVGANRMDGGAGNDRLVGQSGDDTLLGGGGADILEGGLGADMLTGGADADVFRFRSVAEADGDVVMDFSSAQRDRIDLRFIDANVLLDGDQAFAWIGTAAFGAGAGELRFANDVLAGDVDGDAIADFTITLDGVTSLPRASVWL